jgi:hypothetical protein
LDLCIRKKEEEKREKEQNEKELGKAKETTEILGI